MMSQGDATDAYDTVAMPSVARLASGRESEQEQALLRVLERAEAGLTLTPDPAEGEEYLLFWLSEAPYLVRLADLREVLPGLPRHVALPFSPQWLWGVFPLRTELVALVDPSPTLLHGPEAARRMTRAEHLRPASANALIGQVETPRALIVGEGDHLLALVADRIGDICLLRAEDAEDAGEADDGKPPARTGRASAAAALPAYVAGAYPIAGLNRPALALHIAQVCGDIFAAIEERSAHE
ncbi:MAG TPA: chemotaxis protein CheW [Ktedonobacterales bacterium]|jgi:chemotaxis signal transduction protein